MSRNVEYKPINTAQMGYTGLPPDTQNQILELVKETLFENQKIRMISSLDRDEINLITAIMAVDGENENPPFLDSFMQLRLSETRKSREEVINAIRGAMAKKGILGRIGDAIKGKDE